MRTSVMERGRLSVEDFISISQLGPEDIGQIYALAERVKAAPQDYSRALVGKQTALIFEKPSLRTRVTFEVGMTTLGGHSIFLDHTKPRLGEREPIKDIAKNLERWVDCIVARTFQHEALTQLAEHASIPVINALSDLLHPCQALSDMFTLREKFGSKKKPLLAYVGDGNNVCHSLMLTVAKLGQVLRVATPPGFEPNEEIVREARAVAKTTGGEISHDYDPQKVVRGADAVYTDVWASMGQEYASHMRAQVFSPYRVTEDLMQAAGPDALFMHCLPAHRGQEVVGEVIDSDRSIVYEQAENRLHVQKALLLLLLRKSDGS